LKPEGFGVEFPAAHDSRFKVDKRFEYQGTNISLLANAYENSSHGWITVKGTALDAIISYHSPVPEKAASFIFEQDIEDIDGVLVTIVAFNLDVTH
jgi:hypothetical protein